MKPTPLSRFAVFAALALAGFAAHADDIDIYTGNASGAPPNLLVIFDNSAAADGKLPATLTCPAVPNPGGPALPAATINDPTKNFGFEQCGMYDAVQSILVDPVLLGRINLGLMYFPSGGTNGGAFVTPATAPQSSLNLMDNAGVNKMLARVNKLSLATDKSNNNQVAQAMQEAWAFYEGKTGLSGTVYPGLTGQVACTQDFVLYITLAATNQKPQDSGNQGGLALQSAEGLSTLPTQLTMPAYASGGTKYQSDYSDEWAKFMYTGALPATPTVQTYHPITTYVIILTDGTNLDYERLMASMAHYGGNTVPIPVKIGDAAALAQAFEDVMHDVQAVNSVFAAPVLPVSANTQGTYLNQIYMGMFRPAAADAPRWLGNLKQYQFGVDTIDPKTPQLFLADASYGPYASTATTQKNANPALNASGTGFIKPGAISFWTSKDTNSPDAYGGFWANAPQGTGGGYDSPDGEIVEKGGVAQQLRLKYLNDTYPATSNATSASTRNVYTCLGTGCTPSASTALSTMPFNVGNAGLTAAALGISSSSGITTANLINWARGEDTSAVVPDPNAGAEASQPPTVPSSKPAITIRGSVHGDVLHSRPAVINYGGSTGVVVFYGANDGMFRAINGNQPPATNVSPAPMGFCALPNNASCVIPSKDANGNSINVAPGAELWSFIPSEFYSGLQRIYQNSLLLNLGNTTPSATAQPKTYFFDGAPSVYQDASSTDVTKHKAYIYLSARRGGGLLYALDVSDPTTPKFMWKHTSSDSGFTQLGQTWSQPKVAIIKGHSNPVLIFGGGYDTNEDNDSSTKADTVGLGIFILDAVDGSLLWHAGPTGSASCSSSNNGPCQLQVAGMTSAIPADITLVDRNFDGKIDRLYAADLGGNIWRVDLEPDGTGAMSTWQVTQMAALGGTGTPKRKFFFSPDVVPTKSYDVLLDTTGDREHPLWNEQPSRSVVNRFYMIKDNNVGASASGTSAVHDDTDNTTDTAPAGLFHVTSTVGYDGSLNGFYVTLSGKGEKGVNAPTTVGGFTYFGTNAPTDPTDLTACQDLGTATAYAVNFLTGSETTQKLDGGGLPPSPVFGVVTVNVNGQDRQLPFLIGGGVGGSGADAKSGLGAQKPTINIKKTRQRTYWYRESDR